MMHAFLDLLLKFKLSKYKIECTINMTCNDGDDTTLWFLFRESHIICIIVPNYIRERPDVIVGTPASFSIGLIPKFDTD